MNMFKYLNPVGLLTIGICVGTLAGYVLRGDGMSSRETLTRHDARQTPIDVFVQEARTGRIVLGGNVNSDLGVAGQLVIIER